ncbi:MAG: mycothiol system anti-sigma-R factor [Acidimicrobiales bacterium]
MTDEFHPGADCNETLHRLYHFLDGELTPEKRQAIRSHLDDCSPCLEAFDFEAELKLMVASKCREGVPAGLRERIAAAISHENRSAPRD